MARVQGLQILHAKCIKSTCVLCSAVAYCCGAVAPCAIAALLGRFLPRLGPLVHSSGPFFFWEGFTFVIPGRASSREPGIPRFYDVQRHIVVHASHAPE